MPVYDRFAEQSIKSAMQMIIIRGRGKPQDEAFRRSIRTQVDVALDSIKLADYSHKEEFDSNGLRITVYYSDDFASGQLRTKTLEFLIPNK